MNAQSVVETALSGEVEPKLQVLSMCAMLKICIIDHIKHCCQPLNMMLMQTLLNPSWPSTFQTGSMLKHPAIAFSGQGQMPSRCIKAASKPSRLLKLRLAKLCMALV